MSYNLTFYKVKTIFRLLILISASLALAQKVVAQEDMKLLVGADFDTYFDNREYTGCSVGTSQTLFSSRLTPTIGVEWNKYNRLMFGMDLWSHCGDDTQTFAKARPQVYYQFENDKVTAAAGFFSRDKLKGDYTEIIFSDSVRFYENRLQGLMGQYRGDRGFVELALDWYGMYSYASREKFRILSAGRYYFDKNNHHFYGGYAFQMGHYAGSETVSNCVVDNIIVLPHVGARFSAFMDFDLSLHYVQTMQRDRANEEHSCFPKGVMLKAKIEKWGAYIDEQLFVGDNLQPYYSSYRDERFPFGYGGDLYAGERFFGSEGGVYSNTKIGYSNSFFSDTVSLNAYIALQYDGYKLGNKQVVSLSVKLLKDISIKKER